MPEPAPNRGLMIVLAYLWPLAVIPLLFEKEDHEVRWHARNGLLLMFAEGAIAFVYVVVTSIVSLATLPVGFLLFVFLILAWIGVLALHIVAIVKAINNERLYVPGISRYAGQ
jgi:uncharacterized membrane protein